MESGENKSDANNVSDILVDENGHAVNERVVTYMSKETKEQIEAEFEQLGVTNWQELMGRLINERYQLGRPKTFVSKDISESKPVAPIEIPKSQSTGFRWWYVAVFFVGLIAVLVILIKVFSESKLPKIGFAQS